MDKELLKKRDRERHARTLWYLGITLAMGFFCYLVLDFSRFRTLGYCVAAYVMLNALSYRQMYTKDTPVARGEPGK